jgi:hypothetical protein
MLRAKLLLSSSLLIYLFVAVPAGAATFPCRPCAGVRIETPAPVEPPVDPAAQPGTALAASPADFANALRETVKLEPGSPLYIAWEVPLTEGSAGGRDASAVREAGGTPWLSLIFRTPAPVARNSERLQAELRAAAAVAGQAPRGTWLQVVWRPEGQEGSAFQPAEYGFLLKRAAVALTGARRDALVASEPIPAEPQAVADLYAQEVAAYLEAVVLRPASPEALARAVEAVQTADPGRPVVVDALAYPPAPDDPVEVMADAARLAAQGIDMTLFRAPATPADLRAMIPLLRPLAVLTREFKGDLSYDPGSAPAGASEAWVFVRGEDLGLRVIALFPEGAQGEATLRFPDPELRRPTRFPVAPGQIRPPSGEVTARGLDLRVPDPGRVTVLGLERTTAAEREGVEEKVTVAGERQMPVEEILRRLQAFEDAQARRLQHYRATNTTHLRFQPSAGTQAVEATLQGRFFFDPEAGSDWAWETLYVNGVKWRGKKLPEIPLIQPEKAAALPLEIHFTPQYRYRLRGTDTIDGRSAWVVDFQPAGPAGNGGKLYQGTVWVDREIYARLRTRAVQIGLEGEILSNEETLHYTPIDETGRPAAWGSQGFVLPLRLVAQQILSVVNAATVVERETLLTDVVVNGPGFEEARQEVAASEVTMVRDTDKGLRYLVKDDSGERVVKEGFDSSKLFAVGGVFYDDALEYPLPLAGLNYFSFDFRGTGKQLNAFFAGALLIADVAEPRLFGSRFDAGADLFALAFPVTDTLYRGDREAFEEDVELRTGSVGFKLGRPLGNFVKLGTEYSLLYLDYARAEDTADAFVVPSGNILHSLDLSASFARAGYRFVASGSYNRRSEWDPWGLPGNPEYDEAHQDFLRYQVRASKNWYLPRFQKASLELDWASGQDLDRFSKYQFGFFGGTRVHGYQSNRVRAEDILAGHVSYGFEIGQAFRLEAVADAALATDDATGLDRELLGGVGLQGTFIGPWQTVVNLDLGVPVAGPDDGFVLYLVFLKLFG